MKRLLTAVVAASLTFGAVPTSVWAQDADPSEADEDTTKKVEELSVEGAKAYKAGDYAKAVELFEQAYALQAVPNLLFNIAKVYEKMEKWDEAIANYRKFVTAPDADSSARETALNRIDQLEEAQEAREREAEEKRRAEEEKKTQEKLAKKEQEADEGADETTDDGGSNTVGWIVTGTGVGLLAGGGVFGTLALTQQASFQNGETADAKRAARDKGQTYALIADSLFAAGALTTAVGVVLLIVSGGGGDTDTQAAAVPIGWVGRGSAGVGLHLEF